MPSYEEIDASLAERFVKAVDFEAVGATIAELGPSVAYADDFWERFCGSDMRIYKWPRFQLGIDRELLDRVAISDLRQRAAQGGIG